MTPERYKRVREVFEEVCKLPAPPDGQRSAYLDWACAGDDELRREVESLLAEDAAGRTVRGKGDSESSDSGRALDDADPEQVGPYRVLSVLGEGGFGVVYLAERREPMVQRVALKIIKPGMDSRAVLARFEQERQALAVMDHPSVARVYDAGTTGPELGSRPYFVMEHVAGEPLTAYCDRQRLSVQQRLELFIPVCEAVQHAHMKGIIHRDLKPSNILVSVRDGTPTPKVIDFGVAKAIVHTLTAQTIFTEQGQIIGTPEYMSPEQAEMGAVDIDTRSDVYSLGVVLYELLTGAVPFEGEDLRSKGFAEIQRIIREVDPPRPSTRLTSRATPDERKTGEAVAEARRTHLQELSRELRRELEWIPLKAMRKDRTERYRTALELADDVRNYLAGRPLIAGPESAAYRVRKFAKRHRVGVTAGAITAAALLVGAAGTSWGLVRAVRSAENARAERDKSSRVVAFMDSAFSGVSPWVGLGRDTTLLRQIMDEAALRIKKGALADTPEAELHLRLTIGGIYRQIGALEAAAESLEPALAQARALYGGAHPEVGKALAQMADLRIAQGRNEEALAASRAALAMNQQLFPGDHEATANSLYLVAVCLENLDREQEGLPMAEASLDMRKRLFREDHPDIARSMTIVAACLHALGRKEEALGRSVAILEMNQRLHTGDHPDVATSMNNVAFCLHDLARTDEALPKYRAVLEMRRRLFPGDHLHIAISLDNLGTCLRDLKRAEEALPYHEAALEMNQRLFKADHPAVARSLDILATCLRDLGRAEEALPKHQAALEMRRRLFKGDHSAVARSLENVGTCLCELERAQEALPYYEAALTMRRNMHPGDHPDVAKSLAAVAACLQRLGRTGDALPLAERAADMAASCFPESHPTRIDIGATLARIRAAGGADAPSAPPRSGG